MALCILGIDPGSITTGYAFIKSHSANPIVPRDFIVIDAGVLRVPARLPHGQRIGLLHQALHRLVQSHQPSHGVLEKPFCGKNLSTAIRLAETRGALLTACTRENVLTHEITPAEVKKTLTGCGSSEKELVAMALKTLMGFDRGQLPFDVTDALAISLCFGLRLAHRYILPPTVRPHLRVELPT